MSRSSQDCPDCWNGRPIPCAVGCRDSDECCGKSLEPPCERCGGTGRLSAFIISPSGASKTCAYCGTIYDIHAVDLSDSVPPVGDGCSFCAPEMDDDVIEEWVS